MQDLIQAAAIENAILKTKIFHARVAVTVAKAVLIVAERELAAITTDSQKVDEKTRASMWCPL